MWHRRRMDRTEPSLILVARALARAPVVDVWVGNAKYWDHRWIIPSRWLQGGPRADLFFMEGHGEMAENKWVTRIITYYNPTYRGYNLIYN